MATRSKSKQKRKKIDFRRRRHAREKRVSDRLKAMPGAEHAPKPAVKKEKPAKAAKAPKAS
jgi:hypothetical protein